MSEGYFEEGQKLTWRTHLYGSRDVEVIAGPSAKGFIYKGGGWPYDAYVCRTHMGIWLIPREELSLPGRWVPCPGQHRKADDPFRLTKWERLDEEETE